MTPLSNLAPVRWKQIAHALVTAWNFVQGTEKCLAARNLHPQKVTNQVRTINDP
jgi:hypothetical protein